MNIQHPFARHIVHVALALVMTCVGGFAAPVHADPVDLSPTPPNLTTSVAPNVALTFDDSGSMSFAYMPDSAIDTSRRSLERYPTYTGDLRCSWKFTNTNYNLIYYNPQLTYSPPLDKDGKSFDDIDFNAAPGDGYHDYITASGSGATTDLATQYLPTIHTRNGYGSYSNTKMDDSCIPKTNRYHAFYTASDGTYVDLTKITSGATVGGKTRTVAQEQQNFANWYSYYRTRNLMTKTAVTQTFGNLQSPIQLIWQTIWLHSSGRPWSRGISTSDAIGPYQSVVDSTGHVLTAGNKSDFFDWLLAVQSYNGTPDRQATQRVGDYFTMPKSSGRLGTTSDPYWNGLPATDSKELACRQNYHVLVTDGYWNSSQRDSSDDSKVNTPAKLADNMDDTLDGRATKIKESSIYWNTDGNRYGQYSKSLANIAYDYWATDLAPGIDDDVAPYLADSSHSLFSGAFDPTKPWANNEVYFNPANDPATWQHLAQFVVTLGMDGELNYPGDLKALRLGTKQWPYPVHDQPSALDDMWHAAVNSRGAYFSASNPAALADHLAQILNSISSRSGTAAANTVNSGVWNAESVAYQGSYSSADWSGTVKAFDQLLKVIKDADGKIIGTKIELGDEQWNANCLLTGGGCVSGSETVNTAPAPTSRVIFTSTGAGTDNGVRFLWGKLSSEEQTALNTNASTGSDDGLGQDRLDWLRGDRTKEGNELRTRGSVMGAVIRSQPLYVAYPDSGYRNTFPPGNTASVTTDAPENAKSYEAYVSANKGRTPVLYVGANDGMLHALDAASGKELFAFVPASVYWRAPPVAAIGTTAAVPGVPLLSSLSAQSGYVFHPTVDNTPVKRDVFYDSQWHTLLVGTLGMGGRGVYALDVTNPDGIADSDISAKATVLWEFNSTSTGGADLGYTYGQPEIARLATGKWAVLVPGGYFPKDPLDPNHNVPAAANKFSSLFVLDAQTGALIKELKTSDAKTGSTVTSYGLSTPVLGDYDDNQIDDVAFAGDLMGNLWRFDLSDRDPANWQMDLVYQGTVDANGKPLQPITVKPRLFPDPSTNQFIIVFGTGKYLGADDQLRLGTPTQAIYGIREQGASGSTNFPASYYPVDHAQLVQQTLTVDSNGIRWLTNLEVPGADTSGNIITGWEIPLDNHVGERVVQRAGALFSTNQALITTLIPSGNDPCNPDNTGAQILISAVSGGSGDGLSNLGTPEKDTDTGKVTKAPVGKDVTPEKGESDGISGSDSGSVQPIIVEPGGCRGVTASGLNVPMACWRRRSWSVLLDNNP